MATIPKAILDLLTNSKTAKFAESLKHSDLPTGWADDPEIVDLAAKAWQEAGTDSPFWKATFGGSQLPGYSDGKNPMLLYHGTDTPGIEVFKPSIFGKFGHGIYLTHKKDVADSYSKWNMKEDGTPTVYEVFANFKNPWKVNYGEPLEKFSNLGTYSKEWEDALSIDPRNRPYDSVLGRVGGIFDDGSISFDDTLYEFVVNNPNQIKSVNNRGTFNPADPNIYRTLAPLGVGTAAMAAALLGDGSEAEAASFSGLKDIGKQTLDYMMSHRPLPDTELSMGLHDLEEVFPGIYGAAAKNYKTGFGKVTDQEALDAIMKARGNPDAMIDIYRAAPKGVRDFNVGDWVTTSKSYAKHHGEGPLKGNYDLITTKARAADIAEPGDSIAEQGYWGPKVTGTQTWGLAPVGVGTAAMAASLLAGGDEAKAAAINAALADPASREKAAAAGLPYDPPVEESAWSPADLLVAPVGAVGIPAKLLAMALDAPVTLGLDAGLSALGDLFSGGRKMQTGGW